jgi:L-asparagine oxygenase
MGAGPSCCVEAIAPLLGTALPSKEKLMSDPFVTFSNEQRDVLEAVLNQVKCSPYQDYKSFANAVRDNVENGKLPDFFHNVCKDLVKERRQYKRYAHLLRNCPIDKEIPYFDQSNPVRDKYSKKRTFVGEALLELIAVLTDTPLLAYDTRNNGDFFHDVYADNKYSGTQTQKTDGELFFHNDRTAHAVRADYLSLLGMRSHEANLVYTGYIDGREMLKNLSDDIVHALRQPYFITPFDEYSRDSNQSQQISDAHHILESEHDFRYYDTRTTAALNAPEIAKDAILSVKNAILKAPKMRVRIGVGDLFCFPNQAGLHNRDLIEIPLPEEARKRWLLKTYNFASTKVRDRHSSYFHDSLPGLVRDEVFAAAN